ncbi:MAG TPA: rhodanese-like domain-containing protein [Thermoanaerobaculia bacterium]|nr:rhodanese-like domain-containing protein [Thermoanaerobaculia bacterium]
MRKTTLALACLLVATVAGAQYKKPAAPSRPAAGGQQSPIIVSGARSANLATQFPRISQEDALKLYKSGQGVFVDVRSSSQFSLGHVKGALSIPVSQIVSRFEEVPARKTVITYCACSAEQSSGRAAGDLIAHGVKNVFALKGGWTEWKAAGNPSAVGPK